MKPIAVLVFHCYAIYHIHVRTTECTKYVKAVVLHTRTARKWSNKMAAFNEKNFDQFMFFPLDVLSNKLVTETG